MHREAEGSLLAVQLLLAHAMWELGYHGKPEEKQVSVGQVLVRQDITFQIGLYLGPWQRQTYMACLARADKMSGEFQRQD